MLFVPLQEVLLPYLYGKVVSNITTSYISFLLIFLVVVLLMVQFGYILRDLQSAKYIPIAEGFINSKIVDAILDKHENSVVPISTGDLIYRLTRIPQIITTYFQLLNDYLVPYSIVILVSAIYFFTLDIALGLTFLVYVVTLFFIMFKTPKVCKELAMMILYLVCMSALKIFCKTWVHLFKQFKEKRNGKPRKKTQEYFESYGRSVRCVLTYKTFMIPVTTSLICIFVLRSSFLLKHKRLESASFVSSFMVLTALVSSIFWIVDILKNVSFDLGTIENMEDILEPVAHTNIQRHPPIDVHPPLTGLGMLHVTFGYNKNVNVFHDKSIHFEKNKVTLLLAPIGSGKSTLFKLMLGFLVPQNGDLYLDGKWYNDWKITNVRNYIGYVPQNPILFNNTVLYNIQYGNNVDTITVQNLIISIGLPSDFITRQVGKGGMNLSGGQRQLVWCMRVLFKNPEIVLMDEPTSSMDYETKNILMILLQKMFKQKTVIIVTHDTYLIDIVDTKVNL